MDPRIELRPRSGGDNVAGSIFLDGRRLESPEVELIAEQGWNVIFPATLSSESSRQEVLDVATLSLQEIGTAIRLIDLPENFVTWPGFTVKIRVWPRERILYVSLNRLEEQWTDFSSFADYVSAAGFVINLRQPMTIVTMSTEGFLALQTPLLDNGIEASCAGLRDRFREWQKTIEGVTLTRAGGVRVAMDVPDSIRVACQQYLLYFIEFLKDLNVDARAELSEVAGRVLFAVYPTSQTIALARIQEALRVYLSLPQAEIVGTSPELESQRLEATIHHLRSQLAFAAAITKTQQATIEAQQITIATQKTIAGQSVHLDKEELLGGTVALTPYQGKGFEVNLPKLFRELREFLRRM